MQYWRYFHAAFSCRATQILATRPNNLEARFCLNGDGCSNLQRRNATLANRKLLQVRVTASRSMNSSPQHHPVLLVHTWGEEQVWKFLEAWVLITAELVACCLLFCESGYRLTSRARMSSSPCIVPQISYSGKILSEHGDDGKNDRDMLLGLHAVCPVMLRRECLLTAVARKSLLPCSCWHRADRRMTFAARNTWNTVHARAFCSTLRLRRTGHFVRRASQTNKQHGRHEPGEKQ